MIIDLSSKPSDVSIEDIANVQRQLESVVKDDPYLTFVSDNYLDISDNYLDTKILVADYVNQAGWRQI